MPNLTRMAVAVQLSCLKILLARLAPGDRSSLARDTVQDRMSPGVRALMDFSYGTIRGWKNSEYDIAIDGEAALLDRLRPFGPRTVFDVGANAGDWSEAALKRLPEATVHAFEIAPATAAILRGNAAAFGDRIRINGIGLSDKPGDIKLYYAPESDTATSTVSAAMDVAAVNHGIRRVEELIVPVTTGDLYMRERGIEHIDMLKVDVEGAELSVLNGFANTFAAGAIDLVQFEYGLINIRTRVFLEDFYRFFEAREFVVGKLYPNGVAFKPYQLSDEDFIGLNFIACRKARADLIAAIGCPSPSLPDA